MSQLIAAADAVAAEINGAAPGTFGLAVTAKRDYLPDFDLADLKELRVSVVPAGRVDASLARNTAQRDLSIHVGVQQRVSLDEPGDLDALMELVEQIADFFRHRRLSAMPTAAWIKTEYLPVYSQEHLQQKQVFTSVLTLTFRVVQ